MSLIYINIHKKHTYIKNLNRKTKTKKGVQIPYADPPPKWKIALTSSKLRKRRHI